METLGMQFEKWKNGVAVSSRVKQMAANVMHKLNELNPTFSNDQIVELSCELLGMSKTSLKKIRAELRREGSIKTVETPGKVRPNRIGKFTRIAKYDKETLTAVRQKIHSFFQRSEYPTMKKLLRAINSDQNLPTFKYTSLHRLIIDMKISSAKRRRKFVLIDGLDDIQWRRNYLRKIRAYRKENRDVVYVDETIINAGQMIERCFQDKGISSSADPCFDSGNTLILLHAASEAGFVPGCFRVLTSKKVDDNHEEMDSAYFENWLETSLFPNVKPRSVIVFDNAPCNTVKREQMPTIRWTKSKIQEWLTVHEIEWDEALVKTELIGLAECIRQRCNSYKVDLLAEEWGNDILRLPPYHYELNPFKQIWSFVKEDIAKQKDTFTLDDVQNCIEKSIGKVTTELWKSSVEHAIREEEKMWKLDGIIDEMMDKLVIILSKNRSSGVEVEATIDSSCEDDVAMSPGSIE